MTASPPYDSTNIFAKILRAEIPTTFVAQSEHTVAIADIAPQAPVHILILPRGSYTDSQDFFHRASAAELSDYFRLIAHVAAEHNLDQTGYRLISNSGADSNQEVPHFHTHLLGGKNLGSLLAP